jgi:hypothetical protein
MDMTTVYVGIWIVWVMVYLAHRYYPVVIIEDRKASEIRDATMCQEIVDNDDLLGPEHGPLFMNILYVLDFLYYTCLLTAATFGIIYFARNMVKELNI